MYRKDGVVVFDKKIVFRSGFENWGIFNKIPFLNKGIHGDF